jgi:hypothetical protein
MERRSVPHMMFPRLSASACSCTVTKPGRRTAYLAAALCVLIFTVNRTAGGQTDRPLNPVSGAGGISSGTSAVESAERPLEERWGIRILGMKLTAGGFMLDFRFLVEDAVKAASLFSGSTVPYLLDPVTGAEFMIPSPPKVGRLRTTRSPENGRVYWMFFANPGRFIGRGDRVTVVAGEFRAENLTVE